MSALTQVVMGDNSYRLVPASEVRYADRGRLAAVETETGLYHGYLGAIIFHKHGKVGLSFYRGNVKGDVTIDPEHLVALHLGERDPEEEEEK